MKKIIAIAFITLFTVPSFAQSIFNVKLGGNLEDRYRKASTMEPTTNYLFGVGWEYPLKESVNLKIGCLFNQHSDKFEDNYDWGILQKTVTISRFELPISAIYRLPMGDKNLIIGAGLYYGYHLKGDAFYRIYNGATKTDYFNDIEFGKEGNTWKRADIGVQAEVGIEINSWQLGLSAAMGLNNQVSDSKASRKTIAVYKGGLAEDFEYGVTPYSLLQISLSIAYNFDLIAD